MFSGLRVLRPRAQCWIFDRCGCAWMSGFWTLQVLNMKLCAFAALAAKHLGEDRAWEFFHQVRPKTAPFNVLADCQQIRVLPPPLPPESASQRERTSPPMPPPAEQVWSAPGHSMQLTITNLLLVTPPARLLGRVMNARRAAAGAKLSSASRERERERERVRSQPSEERFFWKVKKGRKGKMKWVWVDEELNSHLEKMFREGGEETTVGTCSRPEQNICFPHVFCG